MDYSPISLFMSPSEETVHIGLNTHIALASLLCDGRQIQSHSVHNTHAIQFYTQYTYTIK